jgi:hypothetical protein
MWVAPAAMFIESAADGLKSADPKMLAAEIGELNSFGSHRAQQMLPGMSMEMVEVFRTSQLSADFTLGYVFGLQVARTMLRGSPQLAMKDIKPDSLL